MKLTQVRNATVIVEYEKIKFLVDPWLMPKDYMPGFDSAVNSDVRQPRVELPFEIDEIVNVDAVIITHIHPDHWDEFAENALNKNIKIFVQSYVDKNYILSKGFTNVEILTQEGIQFRNINLYKSLTQHGKREIVKPLCDSIGMPYDAMGIVFESINEPTFYIAGDTIWCNEVKETLDKFNPAIVAINACAATVLNGERLIMNLEDIKNILKAVPDSVIIASHMDAVSHLTLTRKDLEIYKEQNKITNLLIPNDGDILKF